MSIRPKHHVTKDGSSTFYSNEFGQYYHNPNGSVSESEYVFFEASGLSEVINKRSSITIFEIGFGTGLNFLLLLDYYRKMRSCANITFYSIEAFPLTFEEAKQLDFGKLSENEDMKEILTSIFKELHSGLNIIHPFPNQNIELRLFIGKFSEFDFSEIKSDFIFQDAFSPEVNSELWTVDAFRKMKFISSNDAVLTTYCASSKARAAMAVAGWCLAKKRGALGKREMTVASISEAKLEGLKRVNEKRLVQRFEDGDFD